MMKTKRQAATLNRIAIIVTENETFDLARCLA
jgi:hypothetical protein